jgi:hypothetical protein
MDTNNSKTLVPIQWFVPRQHFQVLDSLRRPIKGHGEYGPKREIDYLEDISLGCMEKELKYAMSCLV